MPHDPARRPAVGIGVVVFRTASRDADVLLIRRGTPPRQGEWSIPGGKQEWGETVRDAACREVGEETGLQIDILGLVDVVDLLHPATDGSAEIEHHYTLVDFAALAAGGTPQAGSDAAEVRWVPAGALSDYPLWDETLRVIAAARRLIV